MKTKKQVCLCSHSIDEHIEQIKGKAEAGECSKCNCSYYLEDKQNKENEIEEEIRKAVEKNLDDTKLELPILSIEDLPIKLLSKDFVDWYFKDDLSCEIIKEYKKLGSLSKQEDVLNRTLDKIRTKYCPMCAESFEECSCNVPAFSVKWLRDRLKEIKDEK